MQQLDYVEITHPRGWRPLLQTIFQVIKQLLDNN